MKRVDELLAEYWDEDKPLRDELRTIQGMAIAAMLEGKTFILYDVTAGECPAELEALGYSVKSLMNNEGAAETYLISWEDKVAENISDNKAGTQSDSVPKVDYDMIAEENKNMSVYLSKTGVSQEEINNICNGWGIA